MNVVLIQPFFSRNVFSIGIKGFARIRGKYPPIGLAYIAAVLIDQGHAVTIIDAELYELSLEELRDQVVAAIPDAIGIGGTDQTFNETRKTAEYLKKEFSNVPIILGGPVVAVYSHLVLNANPCFDYAVVGEGEKSIGQLLAAIGDSACLSDVPGIIYRENNDVKINQPQPYIEILDTISLPAWHLLNVHEYSDILSKNGTYTIMITSRGCPFKCSFCDPLGRMGHRFRFRSPENIYNEMALLKKDFGIQEIAFYDDTFTANKKRVDKLCRLLIKERLGVKWECRTRVDCVDESLLKVMAEAGCVRVRFGIESANKKSLAFIRKGITPRQSRVAVGLAHKYNLETVGYYMLGIPGETEQDILNTIRFAEELDTTYANFSATSFTNPNSEMFEWGVQQGLISPYYWDDVIAGKEVGRCYVSTKNLPAEKVRQYVKKATISYYLRPHKIWQLLVHIFKSPVPILNFIRLFLQLAGSKL